MRPTRFSRLLLGSGGGGDSIAASAQIAGRRIPDFHAVRHSTVLTSGSGSCSCCGISSWLCEAKQLPLSRLSSTLRDSDKKANTRRSSVNTDLIADSDCSRVKIDDDHHFTGVDEFSTSGRAEDTGLPLGGSKLIDRILENNRKWADKTAKDDPEFFASLTQNSRPKFLYIGCSDSRVPSNYLLGLGFGDLYVHRNVGNLVPGNDLNALSVIEYAVAFLNVTDIIVNGHYDCGAIRAATQRQDLGTLENWLRQIRDVYRLHKDYLDLLENEEERHRSLVELNVVEQCLNIYKTGCVQRRRVETRAEFLKKRKTDPSINVKEEMYPRIHGMVFNPAKGEIKKLRVDFHRRVGSLDHIYGLYG